MNGERYRKSKMISSLSATVTEMEWISPLTQRCAFSGNYRGNRIGGKNSCELRTSEETASRKRVKEIIVSCGSGSQAASALAVLKASELVLAGPRADWKETDTAFDADSFNP
jgi:hypothetical protein